MIIGLNIHIVFIHAENQHGRVGFFIAMLYGSAEGAESGNRHFSRSGGKTLLKLHNLTEFQRISPFGLSAVSPGMDAGIPWA